LSLEVTSLRLDSYERGLVDDQCVSRNSVVRLLIRECLGQSSDLGFLAGVLSEVAEDEDLDLSKGDRRLLFRTVDMLLGHAQRSEEQQVLKLNRGEGKGVAFE